MAANGAMDTIGNVDLLMRGLRLRADRAEVNRSPDIMHNRLDMLA
jgi:hypothetical protein